LYILAKAEVAFKIGRLGFTTPKPWFGQMFPWTVVIILDEYNIKYEMDDPYPFWRSCFIVFRTSQCDDLRIS